MLHLNGISKRFGHTVALDQVSLKADNGAVHALVGENGSGKSTLMKILAGVYQPDQGEILIDGERITLAGPRDAERYGIGIVYQELSLLPHLSGYTNILIGREPLRGPLVDQRAARRMCETIMADLGFTSIDLSAPVGSLATAEQQLIEIAKCFAKRPRIFILDEPTASLTLQETERLFTVIRRLKAQGILILYISHHLEEIFQIADQITVLRDGMVVLSDDLGNVNESMIVDAMIGRRLQQYYPPREGKPTHDVVLELREVRGDRVGPISLTLHRGEILGIGGGVGAGQTPLAEMIAGVRPIRSGSLLLDGQPLRLRNISEAVAHGLAYVPEDRRTEGLFLNLSLKTNLSLPLLAVSQSRLVGKLGIIRRAQELEYAQAARERLRIKAERVEATTVSMSGGNQQKAAIARWVGLDAKALILNDPTKGIDVGSKADIYEIIHHLADEGVAVIMISSYNPELIGICDRILVLYKGRIAREFSGKEATEEALLRASSLS